MDKQDNQLESSINTKDFIIGALIGGIVGAATALFLAPKSGREIRNDLNAGANSLRVKTEEIRDTAKNKGVEIVNIAKEKTSTIGQNVTKQSNEILSKVKGLKYQEDTVLSEEELSHKEVIDTSSDEIQQKLEETKKAFDDTEYQLNH